MHKRLISNFIIMVFIVLFFLGCNPFEPEDKNTNNNDNQYSDNNYNDNNYNDNNYNDTDNNTNDTNTYESNIYTNMYTFRSEAVNSGSENIIDFEDAPSTYTNTIQNAVLFDNEYYSSVGVSFSNPNNFPLYIAPGGLFWNSSKSLSVASFPFDNYQGDYYRTDDDLVITFSIPVNAVGFEVVDNGGYSNHEYIAFIDSTGTVIRSVSFPDDYTGYRAFIGIISADNPISSINIVEAPNDGDDVNYDNIFYYY